MIFSKFKHRWVYVFVMHFSPLFKVHKLKKILRSKLATFEIFLILNQISNLICLCLHIVYMFSVYILGISMVIQYLGICTGFCLFQLNDTNVITAVVLVKLMLCGIHRISKNW